MAIDTEVQPEQVDVLRGQGGEVMHSLSALLTRLGTDPSVETVTRMARHATGKPIPDCCHRKVGLLGDATRAETLLM